MIKKKITYTKNLNKPRLAVFRSNNHIYAQIIDDKSSRTLVSCSTLEPTIKEQLNSTKNCEASKVVGKAIAERLLNKNIDTVSFDRRDKPYHGRIKALAEAARETGLNF